MFGRRKRHLGRLGAKELQLAQPGVQASQTEQLGMGTPLAHLALMKHEDLGRTLDGWKPVGDDQ